MEYFSFSPSDFFCKQISGIIIVTVDGFIVRFEVLATVWLKIETIWDVMLCCWVSAS
jgi:hypothetical protein